MKVLILMIVLMNVLVCLLPVALTFFSYRIYESYEETPSSKLWLLNLSIPFYQKHPKITYVFYSLLFSCIPLIIFHTFINRLTGVIAASVGFLLLMIDLKSLKIPNKISLPTIVVLLFISIMSGDLFSHLLGGLTAFVILYVLAVLRLGALGGGDIKYCAMLGLFFTPLYSLMFILLGFVIGGLISLVLLKYKIITMKEKIPYAVFFFMGFVLLLLLG